MNETRILLVEDEQYLRELYQEILIEQGYSVETAVDGEDGFNKLKQGGWDLVVLDIILPKLNGIEIMRKIKTDPPLKPNKKVVFITILDKDEEIKEALQLGDGYFIKSQITPGSLVDELKTYLTEVPTTSTLPSVTPDPTAGLDGNTAAS
jgi:two-component system sensor histidine kinase and response regulator WspE